MKKGVLIIIFVVLVVIFGCKLKEIPENELKFCSAQTDCVGVKSCCGCNGPEPDLAINKEYVSYWKKWQKQQCDFKCTHEYRPCSGSEVICINDQCAINRTMGIFS
jgi:hypothetical protein